MGCGFGNLGNASTFGHVISEVLALLGRLAAQIVAVLASGPVLGFMTALVLVLAVVALAKFILTGGRRITRRASVHDRGAP
ncbi:MAG: hypothetical protein H7317_10885 [Pseudorhodobacter sp.]|nr:hypothetical protein [Pseudorhodobacter sp.]